jgi:anti-sigma B factor antagonist
VKSKVRKVGEVTVVDLEGKITIGAGDVVLRDTIKELADNGVRKILLNLGEVGYMDSSGVGELVAAYTSIANRGGQLKLLNVTKKIQDLLQITQLLTVFETYDNEAEALASYRS